MKFFKKSLSIFLATLMIFAVLSCSASALERKTEIHVQVEGITKTLFDDSIKISKKATVLDALSATGLDLVVTDSEYGKYITSIEGEAAGTFGGWDGWLYELNGVELSVSVDQAEIGDSFNLLAYYGDPYGVGMQYPVANQRVSEGYITFTSTDTVTNWDTGESVTSENPVVGATVTFDDGTVLTTDSEGKIYLTEELMQKGVHFYKIEKYAENGLPVVLRTEGWYAVNPGAPEGAVLNIIEFFAKIYNWFVNLFQKIIGIFKGQ